MTEFKLEERTFEPQKVIYLNATIPNDELLLTFNTLSYFIKLPLHLFDVGMDPAIATGETYMKFLNDLGTETEVEVFMPVSVAVPEGNGVSFKEVEGYSGTFVTAYHTGPRNDLPKIYEDALAWIEEAGHKLSEEPIVLNLINNKHMVPESQLLTEIVFPIKL